MTIETDVWPWVPAKHFQKVEGKRQVKLIVIHTAEIGETSKSAESVAEYGRTTSTPASWHIVVDSDSIIQCVKDNDVAYAAPGANSNGIQIEIAGYARQTAAEWQDTFSRRALNHAAHAVAQYCLKYEVTLQHLTNEQLRAGNSGIIGHDQATAVFRRSTHTDPGPNFPWSRFMRIAADYYAARYQALAA